MKDKPDKTQGVYQIRNIRTNRRYIGSSVNIDSRFKNHMSALKNNKHISDKFQYSYNIEPDKSNFVLEILPSNSSRLGIVERDFIRKFESVYLGYNQTDSTYDSDYIKDKEAYYKTQSKEILDELYLNFWELYNIGNISLSENIINKIKTKQYIYSSMMSKLVDMMNWFKLSYGEKYFLTINYEMQGSCWLKVSDIDHNIFAIYKYDYKPYLYIQKSSICIQDLREKNKFDNTKHRVWTNCVSLEETKMENLCSGSNYRLKICQKEILNLENAIHINKATKRPDENIYFSKSCSLEKIEDLKKEIKSLNENLPSYFEFLNQNILDVRNKLLKQNNILIKESNYWTTLNE